MTVTALPTRGPDADREGPSEADLLDDLGDEIARLSAHIHTATCRFPELRAESGRRRGWEAGRRRWRRPRGAGRRFS